MILRTLRAQVRPGREGDYADFLRRAALPLLKSSAGSPEVIVGTPSPRSPSEFVVMSQWESLDHLRDFAGERWFQARILPGESQLLRGTSVQHYEVMDQGSLEDQSFAGENPLPTSPDALIEAGDLRVDLLRGVAYLKDEQIELPPREFSVLTELARRPMEPISAAELASALWPERPWVTADDVRRVVYRLRRRLEAPSSDGPIIRNRRGYGYVLQTAGTDGRAPSASPASGNGR